MEISSIKLIFDTVHRIKKEKEVWNSTELKTEIKKELSLKNARTAIVLLPVATFLSVLIMTVYSIGLIYGLYKFQLTYVINYCLMFLSAFICYLIMQYFIKDIEKNYKKIFGTIHTMAVFCMIWVSCLQFVSNDAASAIVVYVVMLTTITQAVYLAPKFSALLVIMSTLIFMLISTLKFPIADLKFEITMGITVHAMVTFMVAYIRYYNRCSAVFNQLRIEEQTKQLDEMVNKLKEQKTELEETNQKLEYAYIRDSLTETFNRWYWDKNIEKMVERCQKSKQTIALLMLDVDDFKEINDSKGHLVGDEVLKNIANSIKDVCSSNEKCVVYRMGGEEFVVSCYETEKEEALKIANDILSALHKIKIADIDNTLTASIGVCVGYAKSEEDIDRFLRFADNAMYSAKKQGKNRIVLY